MPKCTWNCCSIWTFWRSSTCFRWRNTYIWILYCWNTWSYNLV